MGALLSLSRGIDAVTAFIGRWVYWLVLAAVLVSAGNAIVPEVAAQFISAFAECRP